MGIYSGAFGPTIRQPTVLTEHTIYGSSRLGVHYRQSGTDAYQLTDHLGNVRAVIMKEGENAVSLTAKTDYYPGGMAMPNRNVEGNYRYKYQGQEKDSETRKEAFELRLWDGRIGRWLTTDPKKEFSSPYLGMGNNPISLTDPTGGSTSKCPPDCPETINFDVVDLGLIEMKVKNTLLGWSDVMGRVLDWLKGTGPVKTFEVDNDFAESFKDSEGLKSARNYFYKELNKGRNLFDDPVTNFDTKFGLEGIKDAGIDPYEQFVGSFKVKEIRLTKSGDVYEINYILINQTHFKSAAYQAPGTSSWDRESFKPGGTVEQHIEFKETLQNNKLNSGVLRYINHELGGLIRR